MQIFFPSDPVAVLLCFVLWFLFQMGSALLCLYLPDSLFDHDSVWSRTKGFEKRGRLYVKLGVRRWKRYLPDGGKLFNMGYAKRYLKDNSEDNLQKFLLESRRAELSHWIAIFPFWIFGLFTPLHTIPIMLLYALCVNLPCIIAQRYNRPRIEAYLLRTQGKQKQGTDELSTASLEG